MGVILILNTCPLNIIYYLCIVYIFIYCIFYLYMYFCLCRVNMETTNSDDTSPSRSYGRPIKCTRSHILCSLADMQINGTIGLFKNKSASMLICRLRLKTTLIVCLFNILISWLLSFTYLLFISHRDLEFLSLYRNKVYIKQNKTNYQYKFC